MRKAVCLLILILVLSIPTFARASDDDNSLWMAAKQINSRPVFVRVFAPSKSWRKGFHDRDIGIYVGTKSGDPRPLNSDFVVSAKDDQGDPVKVVLEVNADDKTHYSHVPNQPNMGFYEAQIPDGRQISSIRVKWKDHPQTYLTSEAQKNVDWNVARAWCGYVDPVGDPYTVSLPEDVPLEKVQIAFSLDSQGPGFGIRLGRKTAKPPENPHTVTLDTAHEKTLEAVVFCPGYTTARFYEPSLATSARKTTVEMKPLPMLHLSGRIDSYQPTPDEDRIVEISYSEIFGFSHVLAIDVLLPTFHIATVPLNPDGTFTAEIHDLAHDPVAQPHPGERAFMTVLVRDKTTHNILLWLSTDPKHHFGDFPIQPKYDDIVTFYASKGPSQ